MAAALALLLLATMSFTIPAFTGDGGKLLAQTSDAISRFMGRSPGERDETDIIKGKQGKGSLVDRMLGKGAPEEEPEQRALGKIFDTPPEEAIGQLVAPPAEPMALNTDPGNIAPLGPLARVPGGPSPGFPGGISTIVPQGPGGQTPGQPSEPEPPPPVNAVPEPGTWALMILGFALCGAALRRRNTAAAGTMPGNSRCERA